MAIPGVRLPVALARVGRLPRPLGLPPELAIPAAVPLALVLAAVGLLPQWHREPVLAGATTLVVTVLAVSGVALLTERAPRALGVGLILAGGLLELSWINEWGSGPLPALSVIEGHGWLFLLGWVLYRYPAFRLSRGERWTFRAITGWVLVWPWAMILTSRPQWRDYPADAWWPAVLPDRAVYGVVTWIVDLTAIGALGAYVTLWLRRSSAATPAARRAMRPTVAAVVIASCCASLVPIANVAFLPRRAVDLMDTGGTIGVLALPAAMLIAVVRQHRAQAGLASLLVQLVHAESVEVAVAAVRRTLGEDGLTVGVWSAPDQGYRDVDGAEVSPPAEDATDWVSSVSSSAGQPLAVVIADRTAHPDGGLIDTAATAFGLSLENIRLMQDMARRQIDLREVNALATTAARAERRRLERDLHDGAQARFLALAPLLGAAQARTADPATSVALDEIRAGLRDALAELRRLSRGAGEAGLPGAGLSEAVASLTGACALPVTVDLPDEPLPPPVETTAYLVICEALVNALRHADSEHVAIVGRVAEGRLTVQVSDDGRGGAEPSHEGSGLVGLRERAAAAGGRLTVTSPVGGGTSVTLELPCG